MSVQSNNEATFDRAMKVLPGGVNSPVRAFKAVGGTPLVIKKGEGAHVEDVDGKRYLDFMGSWGPMILGHAHPEVMDAVHDAVSKGTSYGAPCPGEVDLAEEVVAAYQGVDQVRFVSSGTEAVMSAVRLARGFTGRDVIVKFSGCYHGHVDHLLVAAGSGLVTFGEPSSAGVPEAFASLTAVLPLNDEAALRAFFAKRGQEVAAVIIEPVPANNGLLLQTPTFLKALREVTEAQGALLIFDEVISGFRVGWGGAAERYGITPDIVTFGKVVGGGLPVGAFGSRREIMAKLAPLGPVYQAGTLSGNPVAMAAGAKTLEILKREDAYPRLEALGAYLESKMSEVFAASPIPLQLVRMGSIFWMAIGEGDPPRDAASIQPSAADIYRPIFHGLLKRGVSIAPSAYEVGFISLVHTEALLDTFALAMEGALADATSTLKAAGQPLGA